MHALQLGNSRFLHTRHLQEYISEFFRPYFRYCLLSSVHYCGDLSHIHFFIHCSHMIFIYSQSFIHHSTGLFGTNIMISFQLACQLSWQNTALVSQRSQVHIPYRPEFFSFRSCFTIGYLSSVNYCKDHFHIHFFVCCSNIRFSCIHSHLLYLQNTRSSLHVLKISLLSQEFCHSFQLQIN